VAKPPDDNERGPELSEKNIAARWTGERWTTCAFAEKLSADLKALVPGERVVRDLILD